MVTSVPSAAFAKVTRVLGIHKKKNQTRYTSQDVLHFNYNSSKLTKCLLFDLEKFFPNLKRLHLSENSLMIIPERSLSQLKNLIDIEIRNTLLADIPENTFTGLINLENLNLEDNRIKSLSNTIFNTLKNLENVSLAKNFIETIQESLFIDNKKLKRIDFSQNKIKRIDENFFNDLDEISIDFTANFCIDKLFDEIEDANRKKALRLCSLNTIIIFEEDYTNMEKNMKISQKEKDEIHLISDEKSKIIINLESNVTNCALKMNEMNDLKYEWEEKFSRASSENNRLTHAIADINSTLNTNLNATSSKIEELQSIISFLNIKNEKCVKNLLENSEKYDISLAHIQELQNLVSEQELNITLCEDAINVSPSEDYTKEHKRNLSSLIETISICEEKVIKLNKSVSNLEYENTLNLDQISSMEIKLYEKNRNETDRSDENEFYTNILEKHAFCAFTIAFLLLSLLLTMYITRSRKMKSIKIPKNCVKDNENKWEMM